MITRPENNLRSVGGLADLAAEMDGVTNCVKTPNNSIKLSEQLRRERIKLFGRNKQKTDIRTASNCEFENSLGIPEHIAKCADPWPYIAKLVDIIERETGQTLPMLFAKRRSTGSNHAKAFIVILRYGFEIKRRLICEYVGIAKTHVNHLLDNYREKAMFSPEFNDTMEDLLEQIAGF